MWVSGFEEKKLTPEVPELLSGAQPQVSVSRYPVFNATVGSPKGSGALWIASVLASGK